MKITRTQIKKDDNNDNNNGSNTYAEIVQAKIHSLKMTNQWIRQKQREQLQQ